MIGHVTIHRHQYIETLFCFREFLFNFVRVKQTFLNPSAAFLEHAENRLISETAQKKRHDHEADDLREKQPRIPAECVSGFLREIQNAAAGLSENQNRRHIN